jgi:hypothetical protein
MFKNGSGPSKKRPALDRVLRNLPIKRRSKWPELFTAVSSGISDLESKTTDQLIDAPRYRGTEEKARSSLENTHLRVDGGQCRPSDKTVLEHRRLLFYNVVDGKPFALVSQLDSDEVLLLYEKSRSYSEVCSKCDSANHQLNVDGEEHVGGVKWAL